MKQIDDLLFGCVCVCVARFEGIVNRVCVCMIDENLRCVSGVMIQCLLWIYELGKREKSDGGAYYDRCV